MAATLTSHFIEFHFSIAIDIIKILFEVLEKSDYL